MTRLKRRPLMAHHNSHNAAHQASPLLIDPQHNRRCSSEDKPFDKMTPFGKYLSRGCLCNENIQGVAIANAKPQNVDPQEKENLVQNNFAFSSDAKSEKPFPDKTSHLKDQQVLKLSSLQLCMQNDVTFASRAWEQIDSKTWDYSDSEADPASSWATLPNRALLCKPLPVDIERCKCVIVKESTMEGFLGCGSIYSLYTYEGQGRPNRKLAIAYHRRRSGRSEFAVAKNSKGLLCNSDDSFIGSMKANLLGSRYNIWGHGSSANALKQSNLVLQGIVVSKRLTWDLFSFTSTLATWTGSYRSMKALIPKQQKTLEAENPYQMTQIHHKKKGIIKRDLEGKTDVAHKLVSRVPCYNNMSKQYELDFREMELGGGKIKSSVKNFQLYMAEGNGKQTNLQMGRIGKSKYLMDFGYPLTGYQAFCICLASIDSKLCCTV